MEKQHFWADDLGYRVGLGLAWGRTAGRRLAQLVLALVLGLPLAGQAQDAITERAYLEDATGTLQWADVQQPQHANAFRSYTGPLNRGYQSQAVWVFAPRRPGADP